MSKKTKKPKKKLTKAQLNKWRKETNACEHDKVGYQALMRLANGMFERSKEDAWNIQKLSEVLKTQNETAKESKRGFLVIIDRYEDQIKELEKQVEELTIQRNESTRAYNGSSSNGKVCRRYGY